MSLNFKFLLLATALFVLQGCASTLTKGSDRRTDGAYIEDGTIADTATSRINNKYTDKVHVNVNSYNRKVLVSGEVANESVKADITRIIGGVQNVTAINNELIIGPLATLSSRSGDALTTSNVNIRMSESGKDLRAERIKVVTENATVYLLGLVTHSEADIAKDIASTSRGVKKVVPMFDYID
jgi:osmotically-inducible protein OsmY